MIETIIEVLIIAGTLVCASLQMRKDALKARRVYAIAFVLMIAVCIAFGIAQGAVAAGIFYTTLSFSPCSYLLDFLNNRKRENVQQGNRRMK